MEEIPAKLVKPLTPRAVDGVHPGEAEGIIPAFARFMATCDKLREEEGGDGRCDPRSAPAGCGATESPGNTPRCCP